MKQKYDWIFIIHDWKLDREFARYKKDHPKVKSEKRLARSFVKSKHIPLWSGYCVGKRQSFSIAAAKWL